MAVLPFAALTCKPWLLNFSYYLNEINVNCTEKRPAVSSAQKEQQELCTGCRSPPHPEKGALASWAEAAGTGHLSCSFPRVPVVLCCAQASMIPDQSPLRSTLYVSLFSEGLH